MTTRAARRSYTQGANRSRRGNGVFSLYPNIPCKYVPELRKVKVEKVRAQGSRKLAREAVLAIRASWERQHGLISAKNFCIAQGVMHDCSSHVVKGIIEGLNYKEVV